MTEIAYYIIFWLLIIEVFVFLVLTLPSPTGWKGKITSFLSTNPTVKKIMKFQLGLCILAAIFFVDSYRTEQKYIDEKIQIKESHEMTSQMRKGWLSYMILKTQRNKYITFMFIYSCIGLSIYVLLLDFIYTKRKNFDLEKEDYKKGIQRTKFNVQKSNPYGTTHPSQLSQKKNV